MFGDLRLVCQHVVQVFFLGHGLLAGGLDEMMSLALADLFGERKRHGFGHDQPVCGVEIGTHSRHVDFQAFGDIDNGSQGARGDQQQARQGRPFCVPRSGAAFVILYLGCEHRRRQIGRHGGRGQCGGGRDRIALVRHGRRAAAAFACRFERLADIGLHHQRHVARDLAAGACDDRQHRGCIRKAIAMGVPGRIGQRQIKLLREFLGDAQPVVAECGQRARRAAELQCQRLAAQSSQSGARTVQGGSIFGQLQPERHRQGMLQPRPAHHGRVTMFQRQPGKTGDGAIDVGNQRVDAGAQHQHGSGIDHVLAGGAPMHITRGLGVGLGNGSRQRLDQRDRKIAGFCRSFRQRGQIERPGAAGSLNRPRRFCRNDAGGGFRPRQRGLKIEHVLQIGHVVADGAHGSARQHRREQG